MHKYFEISFINILTIFYKYLSNTVQLLCKYCAKRCANIVKSENIKILYKYCAKIVQILCQHVTNIMPILYKYCGNIVWVLSKKLHKYWAYNVQPLS